MAVFVAAVVVAAAGAGGVVVSRARRRRGGQLALQLGSALPVRLDNVSDVLDAVKLEVEGVKLLVQAVEAVNLGVGVGDQVARLVVHTTGGDLALLRQVGDALLDLLHGAVKVAAELGE